MKHADISQKPLVVDILSKSFDDNKSVNYVVKQDHSRNERIKQLMDYSFNICNSFGEVWLSDDDLACAMVLYPDRKRFSFQSALWDFKLAHLAIGWNRISSVLNRESSIKNFHPKELFTYLWFIGVNPIAQNQGKGSELLHGLIESSDSQKRPIYLETSVPRNLSWYQKNGFEIFNTLEMSYTLYFLRRYPIRL